MKVTLDIYDLYHFAAWSGAVDTKNRICDAGMGEEFITAISEQYPDGMSDTELNDLLWFEDEYCLHLVGLKTDEELKEERKQEERERIEQLADENGWEILSIPDWAMTAIVNGDYSGLEEEDAELVRQFLSQYEYIDMVKDEDGNDPEGYFSKYPEFGKPCNVVDCYCKEIEDEEETEEND